MSPDQVIADMEKLVSGLRFANRFLNNQMSLVEFLEYLRAASDDAKDFVAFLKSPTSLALAQKIEDDEQRRLLVRLIADFLG